MLTYSGILTNSSLTHKIQTSDKQKTIKDNYYNLLS
jgi:hypothetical protein